MRSLIVLVWVVAGCAHSGSNPAPGHGATVGHDGAFSRSGTRSAGTTVVRREAGSAAAPTTEPIDFAGSWGDRAGSGDDAESAGDDGAASEVPSSSAGESSDAAGDSP